MGGNALKEYDTRRYNKTEFKELSEIIQSKLLKLFETKGEIIPYYHNKQEFGDLDIIINSNFINFRKNWIQELIDYFELSNNQWSKNGNVFSFGYNNFQIDLIITPPIQFYTSLYYFSYNDLGNLLGRIFHKLGIKLGHKGLSLVIRDNNHIINEIELTDNFRTILSIIGLSFNDFIKGFNELEDVFKFVCSSKYFDKDIYLLHNRSHISRIRDKKRKSYNSFLKFISSNKIISNYNFPDKTEFGGYSIREPYYKEIVLLHFPWIETEVNECIKKYEIQKEFKNIYNGRIVSELTGLIGKELGMFMATIHFSNGEIEFALLNPDHIKTKILETFNNIKF